MFVSPVGMASANRSGADGARLRRAVKGIVGTGMRRESSPGAATAPLARTAEGPSHSVSEPTCAEVPLPPVAGFVAKTTELEPVAPEADARKGLFRSLSLGSNSEGINTTRPGRVEKGDAGSAGVRHKGFETTSNPTRK